MRISFFKKRSQKGAKWHSLSSVIVITTYCLLFFSGALYISAISGQVTRIVERESNEYRDRLARLAASNAEKLIGEIQQTDDQFEGPIDYFGPVNQIGGYLKEAFTSDGGEVFIFDENGNPLYSSEGRAIERSQLANSGFNEWLLEISMQSMGKKHSDSVKKNFNASIGNRKISIVPIGDSGLYAGLILSNQQVMEKASHLEMSLTVTLILTFGALLILFMLLLRLILSPLRILTDGVQRIGRGELDTRVVIHSSTEIGMLGKAFNSMAEDLSNNYLEIENYSHRLALMNQDASRTMDILARRNKELALINMISYGNGKNLTFQENVDFIVEKIEHDYSTVFVDVFLRDENEKGWFCSKSSCNRREHCEINPLFNDYLNRICNDYRLFIVSGRRFDTCFAADKKPEELLFIPFMLSGDSKAVLVIGGHQIGWMSSRERSFMRNLVRHAGIILHNAHLFEISIKRSNILEKINSIGQTIIGELNLEKLIPSVLRELKSLLHVNRVMLVYSDEQGAMYINYSLDEEWEIKPFSKLDQDLWVQKVLETNESLLVQDSGKVEDWVWDVYGEDYKSFYGIPLTGRDRPGLLALYKHHQDFFSTEDIRFINMFANYLSSALANARLFSEINERERARTEQLEVAKKFQSDRIPYNFEQGKLEFECSLVPAMELAGDFFDVFTLGPKSVGVVIGDVATKGIPASLMTFSILSMFRNAAKSLTPPSKVMALVNQGLRVQIKEQSWFATAFYARIHTDDLTMTYAKAGHVLPILYRESTGECITIDVDGVPLGVLPDGMFQTGQMKLEEGDRLILYTDGVTETRINKNEMFGLERLIDVIQNNGLRSIAELKDNIFNELEAIGDARYMRDDILVAVLGIKTNPWINRVIHYDESHDFIEEIMERAKQRKISRNEIYAIRLSLNETLANAHKHGNHGDPYLDINISYLITDDKFSMIVKDEGIGFDHEALPDPTVEENLLLPHGRGVFLMRSMMDDVEFNDVGNSIKVTKNFQIEEAVDESAMEVAVSV
ncbi:SpoIIE family protein phosphatase [bacterium]|nr:SpoIIE family protein phosphatase [bacterium]